MDCNMWMKKLVPATAAALMLGVSPLAMAQTDVVVNEDVAVVEEDGTDLNVSASIDLSLNTHYISYGFDVWGAGSSWGTGTFNPSAEVAFDIMELGPGTLSAFVGTWWDVNNHAPSGIGGQLQEVEMLYGVGYTWEEWTFGMVYQDWFYGGGTEQVLDLSASYDDSGLWGGVLDDFALNPTVLLHKRLSGSQAALAGLDRGWVIDLGVEPSFTALDSADYPIVVSFPVALGFFPNGGYHAVGQDSGYGYFKAGATAEMPLTIIPAEYGQWSVHANLSYYNTETSIGNPDSNFVTGTLGLTLAF